MECARASAFGSEAGARVRLDRPRKRDRMPKSKKRTPKPGRKAKPRNRASEALDRVPRSPFVTPLPEARERRREDSRTPRVDRRRSPASRHRG